MENLEEDLFPMSYLEWEMMKQEEKEELIKKEIELTKKLIEQSYEKL